MRVHTCTAAGHCSTHGLNETGEDASVAWVEHDGVSIVPLELGGGRLYASAAPRSMEQLCHRAPCTPTS